MLQTTFSMYIILLLISFFLKNWYQMSSFWVLKYGSRSIDPPIPSHWGAIEVFWPHLWEAVMSFFLIYLKSMKVKLQTAVSVKSNNLKWKDAFTTACHGCHDTLLRHDRIKSSFIWIAALIIGTFWVLCRHWFWLALEYCWCPGLTTSMWSLFSLNSGDFDYDTETAESSTKSRTPVVVLVRVRNKFKTPTEVSEM